MSKSRLLNLVTLLSLLCLLAGTCSAYSIRPQDKSLPPEEGQETWEGTIDYVSTKLRLILKVSKAKDGKTSASLISVDQNNIELPVDSITYEGRFVHFEIERIGAIFEGALSRDGSEIAGQWRQAVTRPLIFKRKVSNANPVQSDIKSYRRGRVAFSPCNLPDLTKDSLCGKYEVFEDRVAKSGRKIALNVILLPALTDKPAKDAVFYFEGGPGGSATRKIKTVGDFVTKFRRERDVVFIDQRGTGESNPLDCSFFGDRQTMSGYFTEGLTIEKVRECREQLEKKADLALYTSPDAVDDFDEVRAALGYEKIDLFGGSYGSTASLVFLRQHPDRVRSVMIEGVAPPTCKIPLPFAKGVQHALTRLFDDCAEDSACHRAFPNLAFEFNSILEKLDKEPITFQAFNPYAHKREQITMSRDVFMSHIRLMLYSPEIARLLPVLIHQMSQGNFSSFASISFQVFKTLDDFIARGLQMSVVCPEFVRSITEDDIKRESADTYYGASNVRAYVTACRQWPQSKLPDGFNQPVKSNAPVLIISGALDPVTPPELGAEAAKYLPNSLHVIVHNTGHSFDSECLDRLRAEFIRKGSAKDLDSSCVNEIQRPPFRITLQ